MLILEATDDLLEELKQLLAQCGPEDVVVVSRQAVRNVLNRAIRAEVAQTDVVAWANALEALDRVEYEQPFKADIADVLFVLSSPEINGPLTPDRYRSLLEDLC